MTKTIKKVVCQLLAVLLLVGTFGSVQAHHSYAIFDSSKVVSITGTVTKVEWVNPHAWVHVMIADATGQEVLWRLECRSISELSRQGLRSTDFEIGGKISAEVWLARDGARFGTIVNGTSVSGKKFGRIMPPRPATGGPL